MLTLLAVLGFRNKDRVLMVLLILVKEHFVVGKNECSWNKIEILRVDIRCSSHHILKGILPREWFHIGIPIDDGIFMLMQYLVNLLVLDGVPQVHDIAIRFGSLLPTGILQYHQIQHSLDCLCSNTIYRVFLPTDFGLLAPGHCVQCTAG